MTTTPNVTQKQTPTLIRDRKPFTAHALTARPVDGLGRFDTGWMESGPDLDQFRLDCDFMDYVVWSYATPIAWHWSNNGDEGWYVVKQRFSMTTSTKHQSRLYLIPQPTLV